ncbi:hypothetical protein [Lysobacter sp. CA199]|uniref:hypothetical protein n=1 Tax=Lysobacter sp. CA199 TaxID=3455608 RepID=UPI003F8D4158
MSLETIPGTASRYHLICFDEDGAERDDDGDGMESRRIAQAIADGGATDVFIFIHGWKGDLPAAKSQYAAWMGTLMAQTADMARAGPDFVPLLVGLHWPSLLFGDESFDAAESFAVGGATRVDDDIDAAAQGLADTPRAREALRTIFQAADRIEYQPSTLPPDLVEAYRVLDEEAGLGAQGVEGDPGADREPFDPDVAYARGLAEEASFGGGGVRNALLSPLVQLSFWKMKKRAKKVGESGGHALLRLLMDATRERGVRFHLMGHSFGCIVASASVCGPDGAKLPRPVRSLVLVQGALSLWSCAGNLPDSGKAGYFRRLANGDAVSGPIVTTRSKHDSAVGSLYPLAAGVARQVSLAPDQLPTYGGVGSFGLQGSALQIEDIDIGDAGFAYAFKPGRIHNVNCDRVIRAGRPPSGAHSDIAHPQIGHLIWSAALAG